MRILKPSGVFFIIDNALASGQFAGILSRYGYTRGRDPGEAQRRSDDFYAGHGFRHATIEFDLVPLPAVRPSARC